MTPDDVRDVMIMIGQSVLGTWVEAFTQEAFNAVEPPLEVQLGDGDHIFPDIGRSGGEPRAIKMLGAGRKAIETLEGRAVRVVAVLDDPVDSVRFHMEAKAASFLDVLRMQTRYCVSYFLYHKNPAVLLIERYGSKPARVLVQEIVQHCRLVLKPEDAEALYLRFAGPADADWTLEKALETSVPSWSPLGRARETFGPEQLLAIKDALFPLVLEALAPNTVPIIWRAGVFMLGDTPTETASGVVDVTGGSRVIYFGPYFHIPPGRWEVNIEIEFSPEVRGDEFRLFLYSAFVPIANVVMKPEAGGAFGAQFYFTNVLPEHHLEINFRNETGLIEGRVALRQMQFHRLAEPAAAPAVTVTAEPASRLPQRTR